MALTVSIAEHDLQQAIGRLQPSPSLETAEELLAILSVNYAHGRFAFFQRNTANATLDEYVHRVFDFYVRLHLRLHALQVEKDDAAWDALKPLLYRWAYSFLRRKGFYPSASTCTLAEQYAADAAAVLVNAHFPYDTEFEPWATLLVYNLCRKGLRADFRQADRDAQEIPISQELLEAQPDPAAEAAQITFEQSQALRQALAALASDERLTLELYYFDGLKPGEIAGRLGLTPAQVYALKFSGLANLKKILVENGYRY